MNAIPDLERPRRRRNGSVFFRHRALGRSAATGSITLVTLLGLGIALLLAAGPAAAAACPSDPLARTYCQLGGTRSWLGPALGSPRPVAGGRQQDFAGGSLFSSPTAGTHSVHGSILLRYRGLGGPKSVLGFPTTDEFPTPDGVGRFNHFTGGSIYFSYRTGAQEVHGSIAMKWASSGWEHGPLGYPTTDENPTPDGIGRFNHFTGGSIYFSPLSGTAEVHGAIRLKWAALGWERGMLGYPVRDEYAVPGGRRSDFVHGTITWNAASGAVVVTPDAHERWLSEPLTSAAAVQRAFNGFHTPFWSGADGAIPVTLPDGRNGLLFGDTFRGPVSATGAFVPGGSVVSNSLVLIDGQRLRSAPGPTPTSAFIPDQPGGYVYWPVNAFNVGRRMFIVSTRVQRSTAGLGFVVRGSSLASFDVPVGGDPVFTGLTTLPDSESFDAEGNQTGIAWNGSSVVQGDSVVLFGTRPRAGQLGGDVFLASAPAASASDPTSWVYWNGTGYSPSPNAAAALPLTAGTGPPGSFGLTRSGSAWVITGKPNAYFSPGVAEWTAPALVGPWTRTSEVLAPTPGGSGIYTYGGFRLSTFPLASGQSLLAYSRNDASWDALLVDANLYMPQFVEVGAPGVPTPAPPTSTSTKSLRVAAPADAGRPDPRGLRRQGR